MPCHARLRLVVRAAQPLSVSAPTGRLAVSRPQVFVRSFPGLTSRVQISTAGGSQARWRPDGKELYYIDEDKRLIAVSVKVGQKGLEASPPTPLFQTRIPGATALIRQQYAVATDGRFLVNNATEDTLASPITIVQNWKPNRRPQ